MKIKFFVLVVGASLVSSVFSLSQAAGSYYPVYNNPPPETTPAPAQPTNNTAQPVYTAPPVGYYVPAPYYAPNYYGPVAVEHNPGPFDPAIGPWKFNFYFGGGPTAVTGSSDLRSSGANFEVGGGYNFSPNLGLALEFMQSDFSLDRSALDRNGAYDGDAWVWGLTVNPIWRYKIGGIVGGYIIGGGGLYEREERFDETLTATDRFGNSYLYDTRDRQTTDSGGVNIGAGFTFNVGWGTKLFVEARYHYIFTSGTATQVIPISFGFRW